MRTRVKICGITNLKDAHLASNAGADAIGFVFFKPSPRHILIESASNISASIPTFVTKTALFVDPTVEYVKVVLESVSIDLLQFHGCESPEFCEQFNVPYIKTIRMQDGIDLDKFAKKYPGASGLLLDAYKKGIPGGTGEQFDWDRIPKSLSKLIILAGGLVPENVQKAIRQVRPWAVDVSGGVEVIGGVKSANKINQFMQQVMSIVE